MFGTVKLTSPLGSIVKFYSWFDPEYRWHPLALSESQWICRVTFIKLERQDKVYFTRWTDYKLYDSSQFDTLVNELTKAKWT